MKLSILTLTLTIITAIAGCAPEKDPIPVAERVITSPLQEFGDAEVMFYENGVRRWQLDAKHMSRPLADTGSLLVVPVEITVYDTLGKQTGRIISDSGASDYGMEAFDLWGSVRIKNEDGMTVESERLRWHKSRRYITSDTFVEMQTPRGDVLRGRGLEARDDFSRFSFKADVQGRFPDIKRRIEENDDGIF